MIAIEELRAAVETVAAHLVESAGRAALLQAGEVSPEERAAYRWCQTWLREHPATIIGAERGARDHAEYVVQVHNRCAVIEEALADLRAVYCSLEGIQHSHPDCPDIDAAAEGIASQVTALEAIHARDVERLDAAKRGMRQAVASAMAP